MQKLHNILKALALGTVPVVGAFVIWMLWPVRGAIVGARAQGYTLAVKAGAVLDQADGATKETRSLVHDGRLTLTEANRNILDERKYFEVILPSLTGQAQGILANVQTDTADLHGVLIRAQGTTDALTTAVQTATASIPKTQPLVDAATLAVTHADGTTVRVNRFLDAPALADTGAHAASIVAHADGIATSADKVAHRFANPPGTPWYKAAWHDGLQAGQLFYDFIR